MITETTYALHTLAPHLAPYTSHALTNARGLVSPVIAATSDNPFDALFGVGDDLKTALLKRGVALIASIAIIGAFLMVIGQQIGRTIILRVIGGLFAVFFILGPLLTYLTSKMPAAG